MAEKYDTKCMSGLIMIFWIPLEISGSKLKAYNWLYLYLPLYNYGSECICKYLHFYLDGIIMEVNMQSCFNV